MWTKKPEHHHTSVKVMLPSSTFVHYKTSTFVGQTFVCFESRRLLLTVSAIAMCNGFAIAPQHILVKEACNGPWVKLNDQLQFGRCEFRHFRQKHKQTEKEMPMDKWPKCEGSKKRIKTLVDHKEGMNSVKLIPPLRKAPPPSGEYNFWHWSSIGNKRLAPQSSLNK